MTSPAPIERRHRPSVEEFRRDFEEPGRPVILTGVTEDWPATRLWGPEYFRDRFGERRVAVSPRGGRRTLEMTMAEFLDHMVSSPERPLYLKNWEVATQCPELLEDFTILEYFADDWIQALPTSLRPNLLWIYMGPAGAGSPLHVDIGYSAAWNVQVTGRKRWIFFPPDQEQYLYGGNLDAFNADPVRHRLLKHTTPFEAVVEPGELIYTPSRWWHQTLSLEGGISITGNYANVTNYRDVLEYLEERDEQPLLEAFGRIARERGAQVQRGVRNRIG